jgi:glycine betaine/proline transport system ATP-binding protein
MNTSVILDCRHVWKLYGAGAGALLAEGRVPDADALARANVIGAVRDVNVQIHQGEIFVIMGLSGSGKSTLVRCLSRLVEPTAGEIEFDGRDLLRASEAELIAIRRKKMGMVFQQFALMPHLTVLENVAFPLEIQGVDREARQQSARKVIDLVGLQGRRGLLPARIVGRSAAARRHRPKPGGGARPVVPGRTVLGARSAHPSRDAGRVHPPAEHAEKDHRVHHP